MKHKRNNYFNIQTILLIISLWLIFLPALAISKETYKFERVFPTLLQPWYFHTPMGITADNNGFVYVADNQNHTVWKFTADGHMVSKWKQIGENEVFQYPVDIASDKDGFLYVTDTFYIRKLTRDGQLIAKWGSSEPGSFQPFGITTDNSGFLYVAMVNYEERHIEKFTTDGEFVSLWGKQTREEHTAYHFGIAADNNGFIYAADPEHHAIQKFSTEGELIATWGNKGDGEAEFDSPSDISIDQDGFIYVTDMNNHRIRKLTREGAFVDQWSSAYPLPGGIVAHPNGYIYVTHWYSSCVQKFTSAGEITARWRSFGSEEDEFDLPAGVAADTNGSVYVSDMLNARIQKFSSTGDFLKNWGGYGSENGKFLAPAGLAVHDTVVYVSDIDANCVQKFDTNGKFIRKWGNYGTKAGEFDTPSDIATDSSGYVYVADTENHRIQKFSSDGDFLLQWGSRGQSPGEFINPLGITVHNNFVYVADTDNSRIQKFDLQGNFVTMWGDSGSYIGEFTTPSDVAADSSGNIYVADMDLYRIQKFTSNGQFIAYFGGQGTDPGQLNFPQYLCVAPTQNVYVSDSGNNRIQVFKKGLALDEITKAIIVAGGGKKDNLWNDIQMNANFAYRSMTYQGFTKETLCYLTSDTAIDLDGNGQSDDADGDATKEELNKAITQWAMDADHLVLYLIDHGDIGTFRINKKEILTALELDEWLDTLQKVMTGRVIMIYEACKSGSFLSELAGENRLVMTSSQSKESAHLISQGSVSFSNYFWTHIFNGYDLRTSFDLASEAIIRFQNPLLDGNSNGEGNETPEDYEAAENVFIGNGTTMTGDAPEITQISDPMTLTNANAASLYADATDNDGVSDVWAIIRPPDYQQGESSNPVLEMPSVPLEHTEGNRYEGTYDKFNIAGTYQVVVYARDGKLNTSVPKLTSVSVENPLRRKAILVAGELLSHEITEKNMKLAYDALSFQGYSAEDIYLISPFAVPGVAKIPVLPTLTNLCYAVENWSAQNAQDMVLYMIGAGERESFHLNETNRLNASDLDMWLDTLQESLPGIVTVIYDADDSGSFLPKLIPPENKKRIIISGASEENPACFLLQGEISFSNFFWRRILSGANVAEAFVYAKDAIDYSLKDYGSETSLLDDSGNGIGNEETDGQTALYYNIGTGIMLAGDEPFIGSISPEHTLKGETSVTIWAEDITATAAIESVWAVVIPPGDTTDFPTFMLNPVGEGRYEGVYAEFPHFGSYQIIVYAKDINGNISEPVKTIVSQSVGPDIYEDDDDSEHADHIIIGDETPQYRNFHDAGDEDWIKFFGLSGQTYVISAENLGADCNIVLELYNADDNLLGKKDTLFIPQADEILQWECETDGIYFVRVRDADSESFGENVFYELRVGNSDLPSFGGIISGTVRNSLGQPIKDAIIITREPTTGTNMASALSESDGTYLIFHPGGRWEITAGADGYGWVLPRVFTIELPYPDKAIDFELYPLVDIDANGTTELSDAILVLQVMAGLYPVNIHLTGDVNNDRKIGAEEAICILQIVSRLRN